VGRSRRTTKEERQQSERGKGEPGSAHCGFGPVARSVQPFGRLNGCAPETTRGSHADRTRPGPHPSRFRTASGNCLLHAHHPRSGAPPAPQSRAEVGAAPTERRYAAARDSVPHRLVISGRNSFRSPSRLDHDRQCVRIIDGKARLPPGQTRGSAADAPSQDMGHCRRAQLRAVSCMRTKSGTSFQ